MMATHDTASVKPNFYLSAAETVMEVVDHARALDDALALHASAHADRRALLHEICYGACRYYHYFDDMLSRLLKKPIKAHDRVLHFILINACYQLEHMRVPDHAVLNESVEAVKLTRFSWGDKMVNGVLRNFLAQRAQLQHEFTSDAARHAFPRWLYDEINTHWRDHAEQILAASNHKPPLTLRVNRLKISRDAYLERLDQSEVAAVPTEHSDVGVTLNVPLPVEQIPGFADGLVSVQDESAQLVLAMSAFKPGERVLDGCAAPGGKSGLLLEAEPKLTMVALDRPERIQSVTQNLTRLGLDNEDHVKVMSADLTQVETWWDGEHFDRILLDVPCSGSGVIRRHPDIKHRRKPQDIAKFAAQQLGLLSKTWALLANGGTLLYVTCSILPAENDAVIEKFIAQQPAAKPQPLDALPGIATRFGTQRLPGVVAGDGFYYCRLQRH